LNIAPVVNGEQVTADVEPRLLLVHFLRDRLRLTGTNVGCDTGYCGACTILLDGAAVKSCTMLAVQADGSRITTIEGLSDGEVLHPIQRAFLERHGLQCGYCTPGMILSVAALLDSNDAPAEDDIVHALEGNLCRCTGYHDIFRSVARAAELVRAAAEGG
jgi:carbon-monoxide dehydrogenase small subunit